MTVLPGIALVLAITIVAGVIAYIGDRVGHQVGRRRLTLFGLRPRYTSTIIAVATGMLIALSVTTAALIASSYVRTAFFRVGQLNAQINQLQAQTLAANNELQTVRRGDLVVPFGTQLAPARSFASRPPLNDAVANFRPFFEETVRSVNALARPPYGLREDRAAFDDPKVRNDVRTVISEARLRAEARNHGDAPILFVPVAERNLFRGDTIAFTFAYYADVRLATKGEPVGSLPVQGGRALSLIEVRRLLQSSLDNTVRRGFPSPFVTSPYNGFDTRRLALASTELARAKGSYVLVARCADDLYPHTGQLRLDVVLEPARG